jgi:hypothetical protein
MSQMKIVNYEKINIFYIFKRVNETWLFLSAEEERESTKDDSLLFF